MNLPTTLYSFLFFFARKQWKSFLSFILISATWAINDTFFPFLLKQIMNKLPKAQGDLMQVLIAVKTPLILLAVFWFVMESLQQVQGYMQKKAIPEFRANIRLAVFNYVQQHSYEYFSNNFAGKLAKKLGDLPNSAQTIMENICLQFSVAAVGCIIVLITIWLTHPLFSVLIFIWLCIHMGITISFINKGNRLSEIHAESVSQLSGKIVDVFMNMLNTRIFARHKYETAYLKSFQKDEINKAREYQHAMLIMRIALGVNGLLLVFGVLFGLLYGWAHQKITLGDFTQVSQQVFWVFGWIWYISYQITVFARECGVINDSLNLIRQPHTIVDHPQAKNLKLTHGKIEFRDVTFFYRANKKIFDQFNVIISPGQKVGLVGFSGSGKSTFVNLLLRFYDIQAGVIAIDDQNIAEVLQDSLHTQVAMIPQDPQLFHRSLMENIRYGRLDATDEEVISAAKLAYCHEFIEKLDGAYESLVGERGIKLSGGQRQRIAIARAILKSAPILILDEATSSLDSITEKLIQDSLNLLMQKKTTIVIAHRLSTIANMDRILVFDQGKIIEDGTLTELLAQEGYFAKLWNMQVQGFLPEEREES